jgi:hypothetical protein
VSRGTNVFLVSLHIAQKTESPCHVGVLFLVVRTTGRYLLMPIRTECPHKIPHSNSCRRLRKIRRAILLIERLPVAQLAVFTRKAARETQPIRTLANGYLTEQAQWNQIKADRAQMPW